jgi:hypothetical protein
VLTFPSSRDAKAYLIQQILAEADREGIHLSEIEQKMLEYSETENTPPGLDEVNAEFDRDYDQSEYEARIASLVRNLLARLRAEDSPEPDRWSQAVQTLGNQDHYLLVMINMAPGNGTSGRPAYDFPKLCLTAAVIVAVGMVLFALADHFGLIRR